MTITNETRTARAQELAAELATINAADTFAAYWAQSASASVLRDYKAGRVTTLNADRLRRASNRSALSRAVRVSK